jgi:hypothetical protein
MAGRLVRKFAAISPTLQGRLRSIPRISRRVGSAIARKTASWRSLNVTIRLS